MNKFLVDNSRVTDVFKRVLAKEDPSLVDNQILGIWPIIGRNLVMAYSIKDLPEEKKQPFVKEVIKLLKEEYEMEVEPYFNQQYNYFGIVRKY